jgi:hypothetical protein
MAVPVSRNRSRIDELLVVWTIYVFIVVFWAACAFAILRWL